MDDYMQQEEQATAMPEDVTGQVTAAAAPAVPKGFREHKAAGKLSSLTAQELQVAERIWGRTGFKKDLIAQEIRIAKGFVSSAVDKLLKLGYLVSAGTNKSTTYSWKPDKK